jgi:hypothetical protein
MPSRRLLVGLLPLVLFVGRAAAAQGAPPWIWDVTASVWGVGIRGAFQSGPRTAPVDAHFADRVTPLEFGLMLDVEARRGRWAILVKPFYVDFDRVGDGGRGTRVAVDSMQVQASVAGMYRLCEGATTTLDAIVGGRYNELNTVLKARGAPSFSTVRFWVDPFAGCRLATLLGKRWSWRLTADVGGFGAGSRVAWGATAELRRMLGRSAGVGFGYGVVATDYTAGRGAERFRYDVRLSGPFLDATLRL